jgi:hypothetical protein
MTWQLKEAILVAAESVPSRRSLNVRQKTCRSTGPGHAFLHPTTQLRADRYREQANGSIQPQHAELPGRDTKATAHAEMCTSSAHIYARTGMLVYALSAFAGERRAAFLPVW